MTCFATLPTRYVSERSRFISCLVLAGRMAKIRFSNLPGSPVCTQRRRVTRRRWQTLPLWYDPRDIALCPRSYVAGGEFSSLYQNSFHHYRDFWIFDIPTHAWERIETKVRPSARSGHRMAMWKHLIVLFGGFYDPGYRSECLTFWSWLVRTLGHISQLPQRHVDIRHPRVQVASDRV